MKIFSQLQEIKEKTAGHPMQTTSKLYRKQIHHRTPNTCIMQADDELEVVLGEIFSKMQEMKEKTAACWTPHAKN